MKYKKTLLLVVVGSVFCTISEANSWDKYIIKKPKKENPISSSNVQYPKQTIQEAKEVVEQQSREMEYVPEIVSPYEIDTTSISQEQPHQSENWNIDDDFIVGDVSTSNDKSYSQWFDNDIRPIYHFRGGLIEETQFGSYGATEIAVLDFKARLFNVSDFLPGGSVDAWLFADGMYFIDNPKISALPDALLAVGLDVGLWWRFTNGFSWELRGAPGIYSDPTAPEFSCTGTLNLHYTLSENVCFVLGATYRPEWDMEIYPNIGVIWQPGEWLRINAALPESRIDLFPRHIFNFFATFAWDNTTYWLDNDESLPGTVTFDAMRASVGATITFFDNLELSAEIGTHLKHELKGDVKGEDTIDLDKTTFIRATIGNRF